MVVFVIDQHRVLRQGSEEASWRIIDRRGRSRLGSDRRHRRTIKFHDHHRCINGAHAIFDLCLDQRLGADGGTFGNTGALG